MREITLENLRKKQIQILDHFVDFCNKYGIKYFLMAGTLIGAIRHQGYIPWDDDIDIGMLRADYERFLDLYSKVSLQGGKDQYYIYTHELDPNSTIPFIKLCLKNTLVIEDFLGTGEQYGINIDIFPIDDISSTNSKRLIFNIMALLKFRHIKSANLKEYWGKKDKFLLIRLILKGFLFFYSYQSLFKKINNLIQNERKNPVQYRGNILWGYGHRELVTPSIFDEFIEVLFEGKYYQVPKNYHDWLTSVYGNYMELPPLSQRISHHRLKAYLLD